MCPADSTAPRNATRLPALSRSSLSSPLLRWYRSHARALPWRRDHHPYRVWVAEIMLQQTRIAAVIPYYQRFLERFPSVTILANAPESAVLRLWSGLGYYSRARNLRRAAKIILARHQGNFPSDRDAALALPGVGPYTAAAVLSIAWNIPLVSLDGNVARVLARLLALRGDLRHSSRWRALERTANSLLDHHHPGDWNQALMELGETLCTPRAPLCNRCPLASLCKAHHRGLTSRIPAPRIRRATLKVFLAAAVLLDPRGRTLLVRQHGRHDPALFSRLWQFPSVEFQAPAARGKASSAAARRLAHHLSADLHLSAARLRALPAARHAVTFRSVTLVPFLARISAIKIPSGAGMRSVPLRSIHSLPVSSATRKIAVAALAALGRAAHP